MTAPTLRPRLSFGRYADAIADQGRLLADAVAGADLATPVPSCPGWNLAQLTGHVGEELRWLEGMVRTRATAMADDTAMRDLDPRPGRSAATTAAWIAAGAESLADALREAGPGTAMWTPVPGEDIAFFARRFAHEGALHRADAELALGREFTLDADLALDAVAEWLELSVHPVMVGFHPERAALLGPGRSVAVVTEGADGGAWTVDLSGDVVVLREGDDDGAAATVRGPLPDVLLALYRRRDLDVLRIDGDRAPAEEWLAANAFG